MSVLAEGFPREYPWLDISGSHLIRETGRPLGNGINIEDPEVIAKARPGKSPASVLYEVLYQFPLTEVVRVPIHPGTAGQKTENLPGFLSDPQGYMDNYLDPLVKAAKTNSVYLIFSGHWVAPYSGSLITNEVIPFVDALTERYGDEACVILEPFNEASNIDADWLSYKQVVVTPLLSRIRAAGAGNILLWGAPEWNRQFEGLIGNPPQDPLGRSAFSLHIYPANFGSAAAFEAAYGTLLSTLPFLMTEFGYQEGATGDNGHLDGTSEDYAEPLVAVLAKPEYQVPCLAWLYSQSWKPPMIDASGNLNDFGQFTQKFLSDTIPDGTRILAVGQIDDRFLSNSEKNSPKYVVFHKSGTRVALHQAEVDLSGAYVIQMDTSLPEVCVSLYIDLNTNGLWDPDEPVAAHDRPLPQGSFASVDFLPEVGFAPLGYPDGTWNYNYRETIPRMVDGSIETDSYTELDETGWFGVEYGFELPVAGCRFYSYPWMNGYNYITDYSVIIFNAEHPDGLEVARSPGSANAWNTVIFDAPLNANRIKIEYHSVVGGWAPRIGEFETLTGTEFTHPLQGAGTEADPYLISDFNDFQAFCLATKYWAFRQKNTHTKLLADLDLNPELPGRRVYAYPPIAPPLGRNDAYYVGNGQDYHGTFDGGNHAIRGLTMQSSGGFIGQMKAGTIRNLGIEGCNISSGGGNTGAVVAHTWGAVENCYSTGSISGTGGSIGGLAGFSNGYIQNSYSLCEVTRTSGTAYVGGLVGLLGSGSTVQHCFAAGTLHSDSSGTGGLVGYNYGSQVIDSFWDTQCCGVESSAGGSGKSTSEMQTSVTFSNWNFTATWRMGSYPELAWQASGYEGWKRDYGISTGTPTNSDSDGDGIGLFMEYALGLNPTVPEATEVITFDKNLQFSFTRNRPDLIYEVQHSTNLRDWTPYAFNPGVSGQTVTVQLVPESTNSVGFLRLKVRR